RAHQHVLTLRQHAQDLHGIYLQAGGADIATLQENIQLARKELARQQHQLAEYLKLARNLQLDTSAGAQSLLPHQAAASAALHRLEMQQQQLQADAETAITEERNAHKQWQTLEAEHEAVRLRPGSNLPLEFQRFRAELASHLALEDTDLPFVAELVEVQKNQQLWRGAIERAMGSHRLRILVPPKAMREALNWVNQRHNRLHVRLLEVRANTGTATFLSDGFAHKLNLKPSAPATHVHALRQLLANLDRPCVDDVATLHTTPHAMTAQG
ncbi:MAG: hypothetical protein KBT18_11370, partial [Comamonas sp.]|nr:hypothetical protein [Candidatus Comamonas equi]